MNVKQTYEKRIEKVPEKGKEKPLQYLEKHES